MRWITPQLATCAYDKCPQGDFDLLDVRHLVDKGGNSFEALALCIESGAAALKSGRTVIVGCDFGVSRSNSIAAGILCVAENVRLDEAIARVLAATNEREIKLDMMESVRAVLSKNAASDIRKTVLITGGSGFIGRALTMRLQKTMNVVAPSREMLDLEEGALKFAAYCRSERVGHIVHLAYPRIYTNIGAMAAGLAMLRTVLDVSKALSIRLIFISSSVIFSGYRAASICVDERTPLRPKGTYGDAKFLEEMLVAAYADRGEVNRAICRLSPVYGPGGERPRLIKSFYERIVSRLPIQTHRYLNGRPALDLLYIDDAVEAIARVAEANENEIFHFGSGHVHTTAEIADLIAKATCASPDIRELSINDYTANVKLDSQKAQAALNWRPAIRLEDGLAKTLELDV